jgi:hypothetical protein
MNRLRINNVLIVETENIQTSRIRIRSQVGREGHWYTSVSDCNVRRTAGQRLTEPCVVSVC